MTFDFKPAVVLSGVDRAFHRREARRLRALANTITTKAVRDKVLNEAQEHARLAGMLREEQKTGFT